MSGYSGTPLPEKLGIREGHVLFVSGAPENYRRLVEPLPPSVRFAKSANRDTDIVHLFVTRRAALSRALHSYRKRLNPAAAVWVSWPKKASKVATDLTEDVIREVALPLGLVDIKVCAVDDVWSALKLVTRVANRRPDHNKA